jgi:Cys-rich repeat protein
MSRRIEWSATAGFLGVIVLLGCTEPTPDYCQKPGDCTGGRVCDVVHAKCVSADGATGPLDGAHAVDGATDVPNDAPHPNDVGTSLDAASGNDLVAVDAPSPVDAAEVDVSVDGGAVDVTGPDLYTPDGAGTCGVNSDCTDPSKAFCVGNVCVGCQTGLDGGANACVAPTAVCDPSSGRCVGCTIDGHCTSTTSPICNKINNTCTACTVSSQCAAHGDPSRAACASTGACVQCTANSDCSGATPVCDTGTNQCVQCVAHEQCSGTTPVCSASKTCTACTATSQCAAFSDPMRAVCSSSGACVQCTSNTQCSGSAPVCNTTTNTCVQCTSNAHCSGNTPICDSTNKCQACKSSGECAAFADPNRAVCAASGTASGACVQCAASSDCAAVTRPICSTANTCVSCKADPECVAKLGTTGNPGVCMANIDGHCATDSETVYVQNTTGCSSTTSGGTAAAPFCLAQTGVNSAVANSKRLVVLGGSLAAGFSVSTPGILTIVGKNAVITPAAFTDGIAVASGEVYLRDLTVRGSASTGSQSNPGVSAASGGILHMDTCAVSDNSGGGILLDGAAFDVKNTTVTGNGPGRTGTTSWGGILVNALPPTGSSTRLNLVTIQNNDGGGLICAGSIQGTGVLSSGNTNALLGQIDSNCGGFTSCSASDGGATCGAQSTP